MRSVARFVRRRRRAVYMIVFFKENLQLFSHNNKIHDNVQILRVLHEFWNIWFLRVEEFHFHLEISTHLCTCGSTSWEVLLQASTQLRRSFRIFSRSSGESRGCPILMSNSRNCATWLFMSWICWKPRRARLCSNRDCYRLSMKSVAAVIYRIFAFRARAICPSAALPVYCYISPIKQFLLIYARNTK